MKKLDFEYDAIADFIFEKPEEILKEFEFLPEYDIVEKHMQFEVWRASKQYGNFDVVIKLKADGKFLNFNFIINVELESATEQLRELNILKKIHAANVDEAGGNSENEKYIIVSRNQAYKQFFTNQGDLFYWVTFQVF